LNRQSAAGYFFHSTFSIQNSKFIISPMTDEEAINAALTAVEASPGNLAVMRRNGRILMALPANGCGAFHVLKLYQPQRPKAVMAACGMRLLSVWGLHRLFLPALRHHGGVVALDPPMDACLPGTAGVLQGSPEHRVRRAILSYQTDRGWEVAKLAFGTAGREVIETESAALAAMPEEVAGIPKSLGVHHHDDFSILRLPYFDGETLLPRQGILGIDLLESWIRDLPARPASEFPEWLAIQAALDTSGAGKLALDRLANTQLRPVIRHGDFARWNLLQSKDGSLVAIDWEWGHPAGMPGIDLVHVFAQDARLVHRLAPDGVVRAVVRALGAPRCRQYLDSCGWNGNVRDVIIASIAFTVGTKQQENEQVLEEILNFEF
jgi:hypothetical protein